MGTLETPSQSDKEAKAQKNGNEIAAKTKLLAKTVAKRPSDKGKKLAGFVQLLYRQWRADKCGLRTGSLTFTTVLSLVPLTAVSVALLEATGHTRGEDALVNFLSSHVMPMEGANIAGYVRDFARNIKVNALGAMGVTFTLGISYFLFHSMEAAFNDIWRARERRPVVQKFTVFWALATLGPFILALSIVQGTQLLKNFTPIWVLVPFLGIWGLLTVANRLLPHTKVTWKTSVVAGFVSAIVFEIAKYVFSVYFAKVAFTNYSTIYGRLALIPTLLVWIGTSWTAVLIGVETGYILQNKTLVQMRHGKRSWDDRGTGWAAWINGNVGARVMLAIAKCYREGRGAVKARVLALELNVPEEAVSEILKRLREVDLIVQVSGDTNGYMPNRPLEDISLNHILQLFENPDTEIHDQKDLDLTFERLRKKQEVITDKINFAALSSDVDVVESKDKKTKEAEESGEREYERKDSASIDAEEEEKQSSQSEVV